MATPDQTQLPERIEGETDENPDRVVIWMHGLGADGNDFVPVVPGLGLPDDARVRFIFPHAPVRPITVNGGMEMRGWYDIMGADIDRSTDEQGIRASGDQIQLLIDHEIERGIDSSRILLAGFSQGGAIALFQGLRCPTPLAGILALSTYLPLGDRLQSEMSAANAKVSIYLAHGASDPVVPLSLAESSRDTLEAAGCNVAWSTWPIPHSVSPEEIADVGRWMREVLEYPAA